jgi:hypothetical protein
MFTYDLLSMKHSGNSFISPGCYKTLQESHRLPNSRWKEWSSERTSGTCRPCHKGTMKLNSVCLCPQALLLLACEWGSSILALVRTREGRCVLIGSWCESCVHRLGVLWNSCPHSYPEHNWRVGAPLQGLVPPHRSHQRLGVLSVRP